MGNQQINLAPQDQFGNTFFGKFILWAVSIGRYIVVIVELIVISAFFSRFYFDKKLTDLNRSIEQKTAVITANTEFEARFRETQNRLNLTSSIISAQPPTQSLLADIEILLPSSVYLSSFSFTGKVLSLRGFALSETSLTLFLRNLKSHPRLSQINLGQLTLNSEEQTGIEFSVSAEYQNETTTKSKPS